MRTSIFFICLSMMLLQLTELFHNPFSLLLYSNFLTGFLHCMSLCVYMYTDTNKCIMYQGGKIVHCHAQKGSVSCRCHVQVIYNSCFLYLQYFSPALFSRIHIFKWPSRKYMSFLLKLFSLLCSSSCLPCYCFLSLAGFLGVCQGFLLGSRMICI